MVPCIVVKLFHVNHLIVKSNSFLALIKMLEMNLMLLLFLLNQLVFERQTKIVNLLMFKHRSKD